MSKKGKTIGGVVLTLAVIGAVAPKKPNVETSEAKAMSASEFVELFREDPREAEADYRYDVFEITGVYQYGTNTVVMHTDGDSDSVLNFYIDDSDKMPDIEKGDNITIKAYFDKRDSDSYYFEDAIYVSHVAEESSESEESEDEHSDESYSDNTEANTTTSAVTTITTTTVEITTTAQTTTVTEAHAQTTTTVATQAPAAVLEFVSVPDKVYRNQDATVTIKGKPNTEYNIFVYYSSGYSEADGLENKTSDSNGNVTWTWHVGGSTGIGDNKKITVTGGDESITSYFEVLDSE